MLLFTDDEFLPENREDPRYEEILNLTYKHISFGGNLNSISDIVGRSYPEVFAWMEGNPDRKEILAKAMKNREIWMQAEIMDFLKEISFVDIKKIYDDTGNVRPLNKMPKDITRSIESIKKSLDKKGNISTEIKLHDKLKAIKLLGSQMGMFEKKLSVRGGLTLEQLLEKSMDVGEEPKAIEA